VANAFPPYGALGALSRDRKREEKAPIVEKPNNAKYAHPEHQSTRMFTFREASQRSRRGSKGLGREEVSTWRAV
jgi:hypothetical protein